MCGIFGVAGRKSPSGFRTAAQTLTHRGPDGFGDWWSADHGVYLAHCRLAIIDLSDAGRQPMENEDGTVRITFNGEIYNYRELRTELVSAGHVFRSKTDTEVIVHAYEQWGKSCVDRLRGIFAFAIWDEKRRSVFLARDHLGVKPLYYALKNGSILFASEPRAILATPEWQKNVRTESLLQYLQLSYTTGECSIWADIQRLPAATTLFYSMDTGRVEQETFWNLFHSGVTYKNYEAIERADALITEAVQEQLVADVPVGIFLSGGVDSSLVCAKALGVSKSLTSLCIDFADCPNSEKADSILVAKHLGTDHHIGELHLRNSPLSAAGATDQFFDVWDEPMANPTILPSWILSRFARQYVKVALSGDGGDELFNGYLWYRQNRMTMRRRASFARESIRRFFGCGREWPSAFANQMEYFQFLHWGTLSRSDIAKLFPGFKRAIADYDPVNELSHRFSGLLNQNRPWQAVDVYSFLIDDNLARTDRASMAAGLEVRVPLLDHRLAELAFAIPENMEEQTGPTKPILRSILKPLVPDSIYNKRKQGFSFPIEQVVSIQQMRDSILHGRLISSEIMSKTAFLAKLNEPHGNHVSWLWLLYVLENWAQRWWLV
jgi:asparagine synthase (glutamine-hydrolysing)